MMQVYIKNKKRRYRYFFRREKITVIIKCGYSSKTHKSNTKKCKPNENFE